MLFSFSLLVKRLRKGDWTLHIRSVVMLCSIMTFWMKLKLFSRSQLFLKVNEADSNHDRIISRIESISFSDVRKAFSPV